MAARRMMLPDYGTVSMKGTQYYRTRVTDQQGRRVSLYARTREELYQMCIRDKSKLSWVCMRELKEDGATLGG